MKYITTAIAIIAFLAMPSYGQTYTQSSGGHTLLQVDMARGVLAAEIQEHSYTSTWIDTNGIEHEVTTPRKIGESTNNHAWRHYAYVRAATNAFEPNPKGKVVATAAALYSSTWTDASGITHTVNTDPRDPDEPPTKTASIHKKRVEALMAFFPPDVPK